MSEWLLDIWRQGLPCLFQLLTGYYCPGCGGTRAAKALLRGNIRMSLQYHPIILYAAVVLFLEAATWSASRIFKNPRLHLGHYNTFVYAGVALVFLNWIFKNYMLVVRHVDLLPLYP